MIYLLTQKVQKTGLQKIIFRGIVKGVSADNIVYETRNIGDVSYFFLNTSNHAIGRLELGCKNKDNEVEILSLTISPTAVEINQSLLATPVKAYKTDSEINNSELARPFGEIDSKFDAIVSELRRNGIIV